MPATSLIISLASPLIEDEGLLSLIDLEDHTSIYRSHLYSCPTTEKMDRIVAPSNGAGRRLGSSFVVDVVLNRPIYAHIYAHRHRD